ncbi:dead end protein 1 [Antennarius striatus]|uniref:dead end protein 1 n=1 Tax=Antennarius striatus TaxID=241820 RepID=UPI0035AE8C12
MDIKRRQVPNADRVKALETWLKATNIQLTQVNGQRKYGGPPEVWDGPPPGAHCEVFISHIPRDAYEDRLIPLFSSAGVLWEFRLMMNFSGQNRGFAYAKYGTPAVAAGAVRQLHGHMLEPGQCLTVRRSTEKRHLCVEGLPPDTKQQGLRQVLCALTEGVERVSLKTGPGIEGVSAIVVFSSHYAASMGKKVLVEGFKKQFSLTVSVRWHSLLKLGGEEPRPPQKPSKDLPPSPLKPLRHVPSCVPPPRLARPASTPPPFCRAVGGPAVPNSPPGLSGSSSTPLEVCEVSGLGRLPYELLYSHTGPDGFLHFTYRMCVPGGPEACEGTVTVLPGPDALTTLHEARQAAARQILLRLQRHQPGY